MELPELAILSMQMKKEIVGKRISKVEVANPKCLNMTLDLFKKLLSEKPSGQLKVRVNGFSSNSTQTTFFYLIQAWELRLSTSNLAINSLKNIK